MQTSFKHTGNFVYENNRLAYILTPEGRALPDGNGGFQYQYYLKDHLGNTRILFDKNKTVLQNYSYYPFGLEQNGLNYTSTSTLKNNYLYNGKELQDDFGLGWYDYGARFYDAVLGRWHVVDPMAAKAPGWTPYGAFFNNPIRYFDPDGRWGWDANGNLVAEKGDQSYSLAKFLGTSQKNAMTILGRSRITANDKGVLNLKIGDQLAKNTLFIDTKPTSGKVVNNTKEAISHYFNGKGEAADVGDQSTKDLLESNKFQIKHKKITSQKVEPKGIFQLI